jgi:hypothetical protein
MMDVIKLGSKNKNYLIRIWRKNQKIEKVGEIEKFLALGNGN